MQQNFDWIMRIIYSCSNSFQLACCNGLCDRFKAMYDDEPLYAQLLVAILSQESKWTVTA